MSISFDVVYMGEPLPITLPVESTVLQLKNVLQDFTGVESNRQMFLNLPGNANDSSVLASMDLKNIEMVEITPNNDSMQENRNTSATMNTGDTNNPITIDDDDDFEIDDDNIDFNENILNRRGSGVADSLIGNRNTTQTVHNDGNTTTTTTHSVSDDGFTTTTTTTVIGSNIAGTPPIPPPLPSLNQYQRSPYATNFFPETEELSVNNLSDFLDPLSYPNFSEDMLISCSAVVPESFSGSFKDALNFAKKRGKLVLAYLHSDSELSLHFILEVLSSDLVVEFIRENFVFWAAKITPEAESFLFSLVQFESYPILVTLMNSGTSEILEISQGCLDKDTFFNKLVNHITSHQSDLDRIRIEEEENERARMLVQEQDEAYNESLRMDQEKEKKAREEREREEKKAREEKEREDNKKQQKLNNASLVPEEPPKGPNSTHIIFKLPDDTKLERRFNNSDKLITLCHYLDGKGIEIDNYQFATMYPRKVYKDKDLQLTLLDAGLAPQSILNVRSADD